MKSIANKIYLPIIIYLLIQIIVPSEFFWFIGLLNCIYIIFLKNDMKIVLPFSEYKILILFVLWGSLIGIIRYFTDSINFVDIIRDIFYYMNPIIFIYVGTSYARKNIDISFIMNSFIISSAILSLIKIVEIIQNSSELINALSVYSWRKISGDGLVVMSISLAIVFSGIIPYKKRLPKFLIFPLTMITLSYFILSLSRTNLLILTIMYIILIWEKGKGKLILKRIISLFLILFISLVILKQILPNGILNNFITKILSSLTEVSTSNSWNSEVEIQSNWRGYETYSALTQFKTESFFHQLLGAGFGSKIYVGKYAYTLLKVVDNNGQAATSISVLHNGYATQLIKLGIIGLLSYLYFYMKIILKALRTSNKNAKTEAKLLLSMGIILIIQTYFLNGLFKDYCYFPVIILVGYSLCKIKKK